jgi:hypothetical protein
MECILIVKLISKLKFYDHECNLWERFLIEQAPPPPHVLYSFILFGCSHMTPNSSSLFMSISNLNSLHNMDMKMHIKMCIFMSM